MSLLEPAHPHYPYYPHYPHTLTTLTPSQPHYPHTLPSWNLLQTVACLPLMRLAHRKSTWTLHHLSSCLMKPHIALDAWEAKCSWLETSGSGSPSWWNARNLRQWLSFLMEQIHQAGNVHMTMYARYFLTIGKVCLQTLSTPEFKDEDREALSLPSQSSPCLLPTSKAL